MAKRYASTGQDAACAASPGTTALTVVSAATVRPELYDVVTGYSGTPADNALRFQLMRFTAAGTVTAVVAIALDPADPAALATSGENASVEPTYTAASELLDIALNQRATFRWVAAPNGELVAPATAANGIGSRSFHASYTGANEVTFHWNE
ncbi:MAG: hypothetical protein H0U59_00865 [Gemmatimonadaceae bacterium]|nr:hypothetical protein [Gemmatimonadaceae bacterium]